jgi:hypothetical protein
MTPAKREDLIGNKVFKLNAQDIQGTGPTSFTQNLNLNLNDKRNKRHKTLT